MDAATPAAVVASSPPEGLDACGWATQVAHGVRFSVIDDDDVHGLAYVICPDGTMIPLGSCEGDMDMARARFIAAACNTSLDVRASPSPEGKP